jgi:glycosyltransferase involved in cell wall biosynthesis
VSTAAEATVDYEGGTASSAPRERLATAADAPELGMVSLIVPAMNEERNVEWVLERIPDVVDEVILVDGHSSDATVAVARAAYPGIVVVQQEGKGKGAALRTGFATARGEYIVMIDADGSMDPGEIGRYVDRLRDGCDLVKGSRYVEGGGSSDITVLRSAGNRGLMALVNVLYGARFTDLCYGFCGFRRRGLDQLGLDADGFEIEIGEVPTFELPRRYGESNLNTFRDGQRVLRTLLAERFKRAERRPEPVAGEVAAPSGDPNPAVS